MTNIFIFFTFFNSITGLTMALMGYVRNPSSKIHRLFILFNLSVAFWSFGYGMSLLTQDKYTALFWTIAHNSFAILIPIFFAHWIIIFLGLRRRTFLIYGYSVTLIFLILNLAGLYVVGVSRKFLTFYFPDGGIAVLIHVFLGYAVLTSYAIYCLMKQLPKETGYRREQIKYMALASTIGWIGGYTNFFLWFNIKIPPYGNMFVFLYTFVFGYAMLRHRLMDIRLIALKSAVYTVLIASLTSGYVFSVFYLKKYYEKLVNPDAVFIIASFAVAFGFQPLKKFLQKYADRIFAKGQYNFEGLLTKISNILSSNLVLTSLAPDLLKTLSSELKVNKLAFYKGTYQESLGLNLSAKDTKKLLNIEYIDTLVSDELEDDSPTKKLMQKLSIEVLVFFPDSENKPLGFLALSEKASGDAYTARDLKLLEIIAPQISIALKNIEQQQQMIENIVEERQRINQDAHDHIYNRLGALAKKAEVALLNPEVKGETKTTLELLKDDLRQSVGDLQRIVSGKTETNAGDSIILKELKQICDDFCKKSSIKLAFDCDNSFIDKLKPQHYWHLQCILEESLNNIQKHSKATQAKVRIKQNNGYITLQVTDNGIGLKKLKDDDSNEDHLGLKGMKERAKKINAKLNLSSNNGKGTRVELKILTSPR